MLVTCSALYFIPAPQDHLYVYNDITWGTLLNRKLIYIASACTCSLAVMLSVFLVCLCAMTIIQGQV